MKITICDDAYEIAKNAVRELLGLAKIALGEGRRCCVALSGGTTPKYFYEELVTEASDPAVLDLLKNIDWFFSDERFVPSSDAQSNYWLAHNFLFSKLELSNDAIFIVPTENILPEQSAKNYEASILRVVKNQIFDLIFLGMGDDGHTASLFPKSDLVERLISGAEEPAMLVASQWVEKAKMQRITFMPRLINQARSIIIMASGIKKAEVLHEVLEGAYRPGEFPVQLVRPVSGNLTWLVDKEAARNLP